MSIDSSSSAMGMIPMGVEAIDLTGKQDFEANASRLSAEEAGEKFEGYLTELMVKEMRKTVPEGIFASSAMDMFAGVLDQEISKRIAETGGLGLGKMLSRQIMKNQGQVPEAEKTIRAADMQLTRGRRVLSRPDRSAKPWGIAPVAGTNLTSKFGMRLDPFTGESRKHAGVDLAAPLGSAIQPIREGVVTFAGERGGYGNTVVVDHGDGMETLYAHCDTLDVDVGSTVKPGDTIATVGSTGRSTGPHLHLEVHQDGETVDPYKNLRWKE